MATYAPTMPWYENASYKTWYLGQDPNRKWALDDWRADPVLWGEVNTMMDPLYAQYIEEVNSGATPGNEQSTPTPAPTGSPTPSYGGYSTGGSSVPSYAGLTQLPMEFDYEDFAPPSWDVKPFQAPGPFQYDEFRPPTPEEARAQSPAYDFNRKEGLRAIENSASASGLLRSGNTWKALQQYGTNLADQTYDNIYRRDRDTWGLNRNAAAEDYDRDWRNRLAEYSLGVNNEQDEFNRALATYNTNYGTAAGRQGLNLQRSSQFLGGTNAQLANLLQLYESSRPQFTYQPTAPQFFYG